MLDDHTNSDQEAEKDEIVTELSADDRHLLDMIQQLLEPCDRITYGERQREVAAKLGKSVRTVRRLVKKWEEEGLAALQTTARADKGKHRIDTDWQQFVIKTYKEGNNKGSKQITPQQVAIRVQARAAELGQKNIPAIGLCIELYNRLLSSKNKKQVLEVEVGMVLDYQLKPAMAKTYQ